MPPAKNPWIPMKYHPTQHELIHSRKRFIVLPCGRRCLAKGTLVSTPTGAVPIEQLKVGDAVIGFNGKEPEVTTVTATWDNGIQEVIKVDYLQGGKLHHIRATETHRLMSPSGLVHVGGLCVGDKLCGIDDVAIVAMTFREKKHTYDITVANETNLYVLHHGGLITHNSGKTFIAKRKIVMAAFRGTRFEDARFFCAAPTINQAKRIYWEDIKKLVGKKLTHHIEETNLTIHLINGSRICILGMDRPERIEGSPWDGGILDEYANMKEQAWQANVRPALADRNGFCWLIGVPEGRNHYYDTWKYATTANDPEWAGFTWTSESILSASEIASAKRSMDEMTYRQEYLGEFCSFAGRVYYNFDQEIHVSNALSYDPKKNLILCFDFNVSPGVAVICQEQILPGHFHLVPDPTKYKSLRGVYTDANYILAHQRNELVRIPAYGTGVIGEVHIPQGSNTPMVCRKILEDWGKHKGFVYAYGDATGAARGTAAVDGSDWAIIQREMEKVYKKRFQLMVPNANPRERLRINAGNTRLMDSNGEVRMVISSDCKNLIKDLEGVSVTSDGGVDKKKDPRLSHLSDALTYYIFEEFALKEEHEAFNHNVGNLY